MGEFGIWIGGEAEEIILLEFSPKTGFADLDIGVLAVNEVRLRISVVANLKRSILARLSI